MKKIFHYTRQYNLWSSNDCDIGRMVVCSKSKISKVLVPVFALKELNFEHVVVVVVVCTISLCCCCSCWCYCCWFQIDDVYYVRSLAHICANRVKKTKAQSARARAKDPVWYSQCMWRSHIDLVHLLLCVRACVRWLYSFHGACSFNDWATRYVFARCACVYVRFCLSAIAFSSPLFTFALVILNFPSFSVELYVAAVHGVQPATSRTFEYRIPYKRWAVLRSNHQFLVHPPVFNTSYSIFIRKSSQTKKPKSKCSNWWVLV